jgi:hypothetical protein
LLTGPSAAFLLNSPAVASAAPARTCPRTYLHTIYHGVHKCLSVALRKRIYYELAHYHDTHPGSDKNAYYVIANRFRISVATVQKIVVEGDKKHWPLPPVPGG